MPPDREKEIFCAALELPSDTARQAYLAQTCGTDTDLRRRVSALLELHSDAGGFLAGEPHPSPAPNLATPLPGPGESVGSMIGRYKLLEKIGEGGFGTVYLAEQRQPVKRRVALKIIKLGMDTRQVIGRFEAERQALAMMDHPNIARVLDGGATDTGRPYFVMELVRGVPITDYCDEHRLNPVQRLTLFVQICHAIQHAHQKGIIHRDVKPSNVLITMHDDQPVPKVIDFGIAKATQQDLTDITVFTRYHEFLGTPAYMSPEQAQLSGLDIDTRSDIYSLGVLLYELLTGRTPFDSNELLSAGYEELRRRIREEDPPRPSTRFRTLSTDDRRQIAWHRNADPERLGRLIRGDLDWIVLKALEKNRSRRYESASALAHDVQCHLSDQPVSAAAPSLSYTLRKFARRHRAVLTSLSLVLLLLLAATITTAWFGVRALRAEHRMSSASAIAAAVNQFLNEDLFAQADPNLEPDRELKLKTLLDRAALHISTRFNDRPKVEAAIQSTLGRTYQNLGEYPAAERHLRRAYELRSQELGDRHHETLQTMSDLALVHASLRHHTNAIELASRTLALSRDSLGPRHPFTVHALARLASIYYRLGDRDTCYKLALEAVELAGSIPDVAPDDRIVALQILGRGVGRRGDVTQGELLIQQAIHLASLTHGPEHPQTLQATLWLAAYWFDHRVKLDEAERAYLDTLEHHRRLLGEAHPRTQSIHHNLVLLYGHLQQRYPEALAHRIEMLEFFPEYPASDAPMLQRLLNHANPPLLVDPAAHPSHPAWRALPHAPPSAWVAPDFDDTSWQPANTVLGLQRWARLTFHLREVPPGKPFLVIRNPGSFDVYINGAPASSHQTGQRADLHVVVFDPAGRSQLRLGPNVLALHGRDLDPDQPLDVSFHHLPEPTSHLASAPPTTVESESK